MKLFIAVVLVCLSALPLFAQVETNQPNVVQPGAPGQPTRKLPVSTRGKLPPRSAEDVEFMRGMILHHGQAVVMTALIEARTENETIRLIGAKISQSQSDEINFMKRWLAARGEQTAMATDDMANMKMPEMSGMKMPEMARSSHEDAHALMPGMLSPMQLEALKNADGAEFDRLFLRGMIQHHEGALAMVEKLFKTAGAGQDAELFNFTTDVDTGQRAEIRIMQELLDAETTKKEK